MSAFCTDSLLAIFSDSYQMLPKIISKILWCVMCIIVSRTDEEWRVVKQEKRRGVPLWAQLD